MRAQSALFILTTIFNTGCVTVVRGNESALYFSAGDGLGKEPVPQGWHWHMPWNRYVTYDCRWSAHKEDIHIHSKDGLHMNLDVVVVVRPAPGEIYQLDTEVGPDFYAEVVQPAVFGAARDATGGFTHLEIATETHRVESAIQVALREHLLGKHVELSQVAIQHFDLPTEVEQAANRKAQANQSLAAKAIELEVAKRDAEIEEEKKRGTITAQGLEKKLRAEQELEQTAIQIRIEGEKRKAELERAQSESEATKVRAMADATATKLRAEAEKVRIQAVSQNLSPNYVRLQAIDALAKAVSGPNAKVYVLPTGKDGLPGYFSPFMNPFAKGFVEPETAR